jgi:hypothetical protein
MTDILKQLMPAGWREVEFPVSAREYGFAQDHAKHRFIFRNDELVESLGRQSPTYRYTIPFREDIVIGRWKNLFTVVYPEFLEACQNRDAGVLEDPVHGGLQVKCASLRETLDVNRRDGVDVEAEFIVAPELEDLAEDLGTQISTLKGAEDQAGLFDREAAKVDWQQEPSPEPTNDIFGTISSVGDQISVAGGKITSKLADLSFRMQKATDSIDRLKNPELAPMRYQARRVQIAAHDLQDNLHEPPDVIAVYEAASDISVIALAGLCRMALKDFLELNPLLASKRLVPRGTRVRRRAA